MLTETEGFEGLLLPPSGSLFDQTRALILFIKNKQNQVGLEIDETVVHLSCRCLLPVIVPFHAVVWPRRVSIFKAPEDAFGLGVAEASAGVSGAQRLVLAHPLVTGSRDPPLPP